MLSLCEFVLFWVASTSATIEEFTVGAAFLAVTNGVSFLFRATSKLNSQKDKDPEQEEPFIGQS